MASALGIQSSETARKITQEILQRLSSVGQNEVATALAVSEPTVSRLKDQTANFVGMLLRLGLHVVPVDVKAYDEKTIGALIVLADRAMAGLRPEQLTAPEAGTDT